MKAKQPTTQDLEAVRLALQELRHPRNTDRPPSLFLRDLAASHRNVAPCLGWLAAYEPSGRTHQDAVMMVFLAAEDGSVPAALKKRVVDGAAPWLLKAMRDPAVDDERKYMVGPILEVCGRGLPEDEYESCFKDFEAVAKAKSREHLSQMPDTLEHVEMALSTFGLIDHEKDEPGAEEDFQKTFGMAVEMTKHNPSLGASFLCVSAAIAHEQGRATKDVPHALKFAAQGRTERAAWLLNELALWPAMGTLGEQARALADEFAKAGIAPRAPKTAEFSHGFVTGVDGLGSQSVTLFFKTGDGGLDALTLLVNDLVGIKDVWGVFGEASDLEEQLREQPVSRAPCDLAFARALVADALVRHEKTGKPLPGRFLLYRAFLGEESLAPRERAPALGAYLVETIVPGPEIVEGSEALLEHELYGDLGCMSDEAYAFVRSRKKRRTATLVEEFLKTVAIKERDLLIRRLAANLEIEARGGRAQKPLNRLAARTWLALTQDLVPFEKIPYVQALGGYVLETIRENVKNGYKSQKDANEDAWARDRELQNVFGQLGLG